MITNSLRPEAGAWPPSLSTASSEIDLKSQSRVSVTVTAIPSLDGEVSLDTDASPPRKDGGRGAWLFLFGACIIEGITWGLSLDQIDQIQLLPGCRVSLLLQCLWGIFLHPRSFRGSNVHLGRRRLLKCTDEVSFPIILTLSLLRVGRPADVLAVRSLLPQPLSSASEADNVAWLPSLHTWSNRWSICANGKTTPLIQIARFLESNASVAGAANSMPWRPLRLRRQLALRRYGQHSARMVRQA